MHARDIMTANPSCVVADDSIAVAARIMRELGIGIVPVITNRRDRRLIGVITDRDIAMRCVAEGHDAGCAVSEHMTIAPLYTVTVDAKIEEVVALMELEQVRRIPVIAARGRLSGIVTQADIARAVGPNRPVMVERMLARVSIPAGAMA